MANGISSYYIPICFSNGISSWNIWGIMGIYIYIYNIYIIYSWYTLIVTTMAELHKPGWWISAFHLLKFIFPSWLGMMIPERTPLNGDESIPLGDCWVAATTTRFLPAKKIKTWGYKAGNMGIAVGPIVEGSSEVVVLNHSPWISQSIWRDVQTYQNHRPLAKGACLAVVQVAESPFRPFSGSSPPWFDAVTTSWGA